MNILFISSFLLFPETRFGGAKRLYLLAQELASRHELHLIQADACSERELFAGRGGSPFGRSLFVPIDPYGTRGGLARLRRAFMDMRVQARQYAGAIDRFVDGKAFDAVLIAFPLALSLADRFRNHANLSYLEDDLLFEQIRLECAALDSPVSKAVKAFSLWKTMRFYRRQLAGARNFVSITAEEDLIVAREFPWLKRHIVGYGVDQHDYPVLDLPSKQHTLGYIGNFAHTPNLTALDHFMGSIYPAILARLPDTEFFVAGAGLPQDRVERYSSEKVHILGPVSDLHQFYSRFSVFVNPITTGRGLRTKLIEAIAMGRPVVSTRLGAEGLQDLEITIAEKGEEFASALERLWEDPAATRRLISHNRAIFEQRYTLQAVGSELEKVLLNT